MIRTYFHLYGFILGCAAVLGIFLSEKKAEVHHFPKDLFWQLLTSGLIAGLVGSRLWHVLTDFHLYQNNLISSLYIWNGGLSIIGGILGGLVGIFGYSFYFKKVSLKNIAIFLDLCIFGLPFAQALGRLGNWVNYELYGLPTNLPWKIFIPLEFRAAGFEKFSYFHPLFAYEAIAMILFGGVVWWLDRSPKNPLKIGSNTVLFSYLVYYAGIRFLLDFIRIGTPTLGVTGLGFNQVILVVVGVTSGFLLYKKIQKR